ncbi:DarT ssDNA thymidine ADP-ribosyltransferase family protein [Rhodophyticola sp.]|uniref:DarT ssDNA thymidine ADP-ribosyltransferase family protein n=1 Tax=Rhodophyticola sp. TaxID=2680032 RepID=UPI003D2BFB72
MTHINNVPWISSMAPCKNSGVQDPNFVRIEPQLIQRRTARNIPVAPNGSLSDYIPFYFTPFSMMMYNIKTGYGGIRQFPNTEIVIMASSLRGLEDRGA